MRRACCRNSGPGLPSESRSNEDSSAKAGTWAGHRWRWQSVCRRVMRQLRVGARRALHHLILIRIRGALRQAAYTLRPRRHLCLPQVSSAYCDASAQAMQAVTETREHFWGGGNRTPAPPPAAADWNPVRSCCLHAVGDRHTATLSGATQRSTSAEHAASTAARGVWQGRAGGTAGGRRCAFRRCRQQASSKSADSGAIVYGTGEIATRMRSSRRCSSCASENVDTVCWGRQFKGSKSRRQSD